MGIAEYQSLGRLLPTMVLSLFWSGVMVVSMLYQIIVKGPRRYFHVKRREERPALLDDPALGTHHFARLKNIRLHYVSRGADNKPLVLFVHGYPEFWFSWRYQLKDLGPDFRAVAYDQRGYGESEKPEGVAQYRMEKLTDDIKELIEYLGYTSCILVGHDWGGAVAWSFATKYPEMVDKLVCCNIPNPFAFQKHMQKHPSQLLKSWYMFFFQMPYLPEIFLRSEDLSFLRGAFMSKKHGVRQEYFNDEDLEAFKYTFKNYGDMVGPINFYRSALRHKPERLPSNKVQCPTLVIWGDRDAFLESQMADMSKEYVNNTCQVEHIADATHWVQQDAHSEVTRLIREFSQKDKE